MKKVLKFLLPILIFTILATILVLPSSAAADEEGIAVWNSYEAYLANPGKPDAQYKSTQLTTDLISGKGYVLFYSDIEISSDVQLARGQKIIIDLNGHTLSAKKKIIINGPSSGNWINEIGSVKIQNGKLIATASQFLQSRPNSEIYFENVDVTSQSGTFLYDSSLRIIHFKDCTFTVGNPTTVFSLSTTFDCSGADRLYKDENGNQLDYVRNIVFDNTTFIDESKQINETTFETNIIRIPDTAKYNDNIAVSFINNSSFNVLRDNLFADFSSSELDHVFSVNVEKGCKFATDEVPIEATQYFINYYNDIEVVGNRVLLGQANKLHVGGEQTPENPELIWGKSGDPAYPSMLCQYHCKVTWINGEERVEETGYAEGATLSRSATARGYYVNAEDNNRIYVDIHEGWATSPDSAEALKNVKITERENTLYSVFSSKKVHVVEFSSSELKIENIISAITDDDITAEAFEGFKNGSYVYFYDDVTYSSDDSIKLSNVVLTLDLGGNTFFKDKNLAYASGNIELYNSTLNIMNGTLSSSRAAIASLYDNSAVNIDENTTVLFDTVPAFTIASGKVTVAKARVEQRSADTSVPMVLFAPDSASVEFTATESELLASGALTTVIPGTAATANVKVDIAKSKVTGDSVFAVYENVANNVSGITVSVSLAETLVDSREVYDLATTDANTEALNATFTIDEKSRFSSKPVAAYGNLILPEGYGILGYDDPVYSYTIGIGSISLKFNVSLYMNFTANYYVPTSANVTFAQTYLNRFTADELSRKTIDGVEYYVVSIGGISISDSLKPLDLKVGFVGTDGREYVTEVTYSPIDYFTELLGAADPLTRKLAASAVTYIASAYEYSMAVLPEKFAELLLSDEYANNLRASSEIPLIVDKSERGNIALAISTAQLSLSDTLAVRFNLSESFSGNLTIGDDTFVVENGKVGEVGYVQVSVSAYELHRMEISISGQAQNGTSVNGEYCLAAYANAVKDNAPLYNMLQSLFSYCYEAFVYSNGGVLPPYIDHTPPIDAELR